ncbi:glycosyltransferase [Rhodococcus sp. JVH1]|uniref:glycosyltransferase n=1 Tax=Rhodococcus sp. JVH1 TaxID=745408 RepID=UPI000A034CD6|nr:glycosyltransferase family 2 protein [Rhodococcus sp. JVH1]
MNADHPSLEAVQNSVGVVIVHYYRFSDLLHLVSELIETQGVCPTNIVVCDNGSNPGEMETLHSCHSRIEIRAFPNVGYGAAVNHGVAALPASCDFIFIATHELRLDEGCLAALASVMQSDDNLGMVGPLLKHLDRPAEVWSVGGQFRGLRRLPEHLLEVGSEVPVARTCDWLDGCAVLARRTSLRHVGGLAEAYFLYFEDVELGCAMRTAGWGVASYSGAVAYQSPGGHMDHRLAIRNLAWLHRQYAHWIPYALWTIENLVRVVVGTIVRPRGALIRQRGRVLGLIQAFRLPDELHSRRLNMRTSAIRPLVATTSSTRAQGGYPDAE